MASDLCLHCLLKPACPNTLLKYVNLDEIESPGGVPELKISKRYEDTDIYNITKHSCGLLNDPDYYYVFTYFYTH